MTVLSSLFGGALAGNEVTTIAKLTKASRASANITDNESSAGNAATAAGFFTNIALHGADVDTNWTADTYKTLATISGAGVMVSVITPTLNAAEVATLEVTVDGGTAQTLAITMAGAAERGIVGAFFPGSVSASSVTYRGIRLAGLDSAKRYVNTDTLALPATHYAKLYGMRTLRFETSLLVRMKTSVSLSTTTNQERRCGVTYVLD